MPFDMENEEKDESKAETEEESSLGEALKSALKEGSGEDIEMAVKAMVLKCLEEEDSADGGEY